MRQIDWEKPLSDEDRVWALQSSIMGIEQKVADNDARFSPEPEETGEEKQSEEVPPYTEWKLADLRTEAEVRKLSPKASATKAELAAMLEANDEEAKSAGE